MLRSMYSGISGLKVNQTKLDVIGNNIANVGTTAFKNQRIRFQDVLSQNLKFGTGASANVGGTNPSQVGLGVEVAGIDTMVSQGNMQPTGSNLDFAVDGDGYFVVARGEAKEMIEVADAPNSGKGKPLADDATINYTRDGSFTLDDQGQLLTSDGYRVLGYLPTGAKAMYSTGDTPSTLEIQEIKAGAKLTVEKKLQPLLIPDEVTYGGKSMKIKNFSVDKNGTINAVLASNEVVAIGQIGMASFKNPAGLTKEGKNLYSTSASSGEALYRGGVGSGENEEGYGDIIQGRLEMSNVDLAEQFTEMIVASRAFQANGKIITTGDEILQDLVNLKR
ncbi:MAG: flagellar hook-basal body complex protein [Clostridium cochlearium]|uniref:flagellar hook-basal body complex protein n=1 Tax=Clostridium cochlearium TaxID=1494 RepID=UPI00280B18AD|nr:flagellar hook-basal body complex protein [Clostridium cochlearium]MDU1442806.1 flagellar hook-basal body complex protein [Clostridium cochlearium]